MDRKLVIVGAGAGLAVSLIKQLQDAGVELVEAVPELQLERTVRDLEPCGVSLSDLDDGRTFKGKRQAQWKQDAYCKPGRHRLK